MEGNAATRFTAGRLSREAATIYCYEMSRQTQVVALTDNLLPYINIPVGGQGYILSRTGPCHILRVAASLNPFIERTPPYKPDCASHVKE